MSMLQPWSTGTNARTAGQQYRGSQQSNVLEVAASRWYAFCIYADGGKLQPNTWEAFHDKTLGLC